MEYSLIFCLHFNLPELIILMDAEETIVCGETEEGEYVEFIVEATNSPIRPWSRLPQQEEDEDEVEEIDGE